MPDVVIAGAARTPIGAFRGALAPLPAAALGGAAIRAALGAAGGPVPDETLIGCVLSAGQGQAPARQAGFHAGLSEDVPATTVNKMCGSGMAAAMIAFDRIALGHGACLVAGGMESMSNAPYLLPAMRSGARLGHAGAIDHMFLDGLEDAYDRGRLMGTFAEDCAAAYGFTRKDQDAYALASLDRVRAFAHAPAPVAVPGRDGPQQVAEDETPQRVRPERMESLKPAFRDGGTVTAGNASSISDGAAALVLAAGGTAGPVRARILGHATHAGTPGRFTTAPVGAARKLLDRVGWRAGDVDLWEVNEAFAVVPMAFMREFDLPQGIVNMAGGACALGHPIGASGARILVTLLDALEASGGRRGVAAICIGGGEATAMAMERP